MLYDLLFPWQKQIIDKFENRNKFALYLDMGLGKTPISLAFAERHKCNKILIITIEKKATEGVEVDGSFFNWANKIDTKYNMYTKQYGFNSDTPKKWYRDLSPENNDILILNYESLFKRRKKELGENKKNRNCELKENILDFIKSCTNQRVCIIVDESHKIKNYESLQSKAIRKICQLINIKTPYLYLYLLTGTPFTQGFIDLYSQLKLLGWEKNKTYFIDNFCIRGNIKGLLDWEQPIVGYKNVEQIYNLVHQFGITIKSGEVISLPEQVFVYHKLNQSNEMILYTCEKLKRVTIQNRLDKINSDYELPIPPRGGRINNPFYRNIAFPDLKWTAETIATFWLRARQLSIGFQGNAKEALWFNSNRLKELRDLLETYPDNYILFYNYTPELLQIYDICEMLGYKIDVYCGEIKSEIFYNKYVSQTEEERLVNTKNIILVNFASGSEGGNWQLYNKCIIFSLPLYKDYEQGIKRIHRIGQKNTVIYHIFYEDNWLDNSMLQSLQEAKNYNKELFESDLKEVQKLFEKKPY